MIQRRGLPRMPATSSTLTTSSSSGKLLVLLDGPSRRAGVSPARSARLSPSPASSNRQNDAMNTLSALVATIRAVCASSTPALLGSATSSSHLGTEYSPASPDLRSTRGMPSPPTVFRINHISGRCKFELNVYSGPFPPARKEPLPSQMDEVVGLVPTSWRIIHRSGSRTGT